jgi:transcriptional regulator with XRE-family HTH domain
MATSGVIIREARQRHGLTQKQLATRARTTQAAISRIERDVVSPSVSTVVRLLDLMGERLDLDVHPIHYGFDVTLNEANLALSPEERIREQARRANTIRELQREIGVEPVEV